MKHSLAKKPRSVGKRYPGQQQNFARSIAQRNHNKPNSFAKPYRKANLPSPEAFYETQIDGFSVGSNGWAHGCCPFHDDHNPSFAMNLESGGYKCLSSNCGAAGGSIVSFVCSLHGLSTSEAYRFLEARS